MKPIRRRSNKKILLIDVGNYEYFRLFAKACSYLTETTVIGKYYVGDWTIPMFYKYSEKMKDGLLRRIVRLVEYIVGYVRVLGYVRENHFDIIHVHWAVVPLVDIFFFKKLKKYTGRLVYTAHDAVPHVASPKKMKIFKKLYKIPDKIIVHGNYCKNEFAEFFPESLDKVYVQEFGAPEKRSVEFDETLCEKHIKLKQLCKRREKCTVISFIGQISPYKGLDLLIDAWENYKDRDDLFLLVAGRTVVSYAVLENALKKLNDYKNSYLYNARFTDSEESFFYSLSDIIVLPYRTASMSAVLYSAAKYEKTVLSTMAGCLKEYLEQVKDIVFDCEPTLEALSLKLDYIIENYSNEKLGEYGKRFSEYIYKRYAWDKILKKVIEECYEI